LTFQQDYADRRCVQIAITESNRSRVIGWLVGDW
jgi:hypothetical protein